MSERESRRRPITPEVVDLTNDNYIPTTRPNRRKPLNRSNDSRGTYIDLTTSPLETPAGFNSPSSSTSNGELAQPVVDVEILFESRTGMLQPSARLRRQQHPLPSIDNVQIGEVEVVTHDDDDLPNIQVPTKKQRSSQNSPNKEDESPSLSCPICLETYAKLQMQNINAVVISACSHVFCKTCIEEVLKTKKQCPMCRRALRGKTPFKVLLF